MRHLPIVINQMLGMIPAENTGLIRDLKKHFTINEYRAPEVCDWAGTSKMLQLHLEGRESEPWVAALLDVWQDKLAKNLVE